MSIETNLHEKKEDTFWEKYKNDLSSKYIWLRVTTIVAIIAAFFIIGNYVGCEGSKESIYIIEVTYFDGTKEIIRTGACANNYPPTLSSDGTVGCIIKNYANYVRTMRVLGSE